jgi:hypothetical protein
VIVAADLGRQVTLAATGARCGRISVFTNMQNEDVFSTQAPADLLVGLGQSSNDQDPPTYRGFCGFDLGTLPAGDLLSATLRLYQKQVDAGAYGTSTAVVAEQVDLGAALDEDDYGAAALAQVGPLSTTEAIESKSLDVTGAVLADIDAGRAFADYRIYGSNLDGVAAFDGPSGTHPPALILVYGD